MRVTKHRLITPDTPLPWVGYQAELEARTRWSLFNNVTLHIEIYAGKQLHFGHLILWSKKGNQILHRLETPTTPRGLYLLRKQSVNDFKLDVLNLQGIAEELGYH